MTRRKAAKRLFQEVISVVALLKASILMQSGGGGPGSARKDARTEIRRNN